MPPEAAPLVRASDVEVRYASRRSPWRKGAVVNALDGVTLDVRIGRTLALVGPSGSGKSTLARCLVALERPTGGEVRYDGRDPFDLRGAARLAFRRDMQLLFQDAGASLSPRWTAAEIVAEPLHVQGIGPRGSRRGRALALMESVGLPAVLGGRAADELSGGQRQRLAIVRALALEPRLLVLDEAFSGLDRPVQGQVLRLLADLRARMGFGLVLISHDLGLVRHVADDIAVLQRGRIVEEGRAELVLAAPLHEETRRLVAAVLPMPPVGPCRSWD